MIPKVQAPKLSSAQMNDRQEIKLETTIPQEWMDRFEDLAKQTGRSLTELIQEALAQYIGADLGARSPSQLEQFRSELAFLRQKVTELEPYKERVEMLSVRLEAIEGKRSQAENKSTSSQNLPLDEADDDDFDDEPDEILTDFLPR